MSDRNNEVKKPVKNQLFTASVTGVTFEDFSQNAILFPAQDLPTTSTVVNTPNEPPSSVPELPITTTEESIATFQQQEIPLQQDTQTSADQQGTSQLSSVFSSFSNILTFGGSPNPEPPSSVNPPTPPTNISAQTKEILEPVPLIPSNSFNANGTFQNPLLPPSQTNILKPSSPPQGPPSNLYRRTGLKKPAYAQVPGLLSTKSPSSGENSMVIGNPLEKTISPIPPSFSPFQPPDLGLQNIQQPTTSNYFQPISSERISPASSLRTTPGIVPSVISPVESTGTSTSSSILQPEDPATILPPTSSSGFDSNPIGLKPFNSSIFSTSSTQHSSASAILNPTVPFFSALTSTQTFSSPVMAAAPNNQTSQTSVPSTNTYGSQNGVQSPVSAPALTSSNIYRPVYHHWFYKKVVEGRTLWQPFSMVDSLALEEAFTSADLSPNTVVATDGGRYDVNILRRERYPAYWTTSPTEVRRCSWFHKGNAEGRFLPYEENIATMLEEEYRTAYETNEWHRKVELPNGETVVFHGPDVLVLFPPAQATADVWGNTPQTQPRPRVVKRGMDEFDIDEGEPAIVDHLLFIVHGIGAVCDLKFRTVEEVVDEFRNISLQLVRSHYRSSCDNQVVNRVEVLPISWHSRLHSEDTGIDRNLKNITLQSIPRLRDFTNDTLLDILFYTSPMYCQTIITTVGTELNRIYELFKQRNPSFCGGVSLGGHSLGSLILFDLLSHQHPEPEKEPKNAGDEDIVPPLKKPHPKDRRLSRRISYMMSEAGTGQPQLQYPHLHFQPIAFFALGSPIGMFVTVRGLDKLGKDFALPTCPAFFNIFHPYDPVAYRIESLINPELANLKPVLIPHHKGRKRMHLELKETMARVSADLKQKLIDSMKNTWNTFFQMALFGRQDNNPPSLEAEVDKVFEERLAEEEAKQESINAQNEEDQKTDLYLGILNKGRRIDYVLQEAPLESFNEYLFALTSHVCYWESEDTMLLILKEIYSSMGIGADNQIPQQTMRIERPCPSPKPFISEQPSSSKQPTGLGMDPTLPISQNVNIGPPPTSGFVRKS
ncbi:hypothetical protein ILUMI_26536 [Ignelater luminosus]|uniref:Uncharacterized protein n=1 Tax=Ignelater luminosus TaxID=2038154 RepID=A0A8K0C486_IGNLU|nr:hypothetical protein ILUMI_26536 [Ignelater luminosus]